MPTITTERPKIKGGAAFSTLDEIYPIGIAKYQSNVGLFTVKNARWNAPWGTNLLIALGTASALPDDQSRLGYIDSLMILRDIQQVNSIIIANDLSGLIENSFTSNLSLEIFGFVILNNWYLGA